MLIPNTFWPDDDEINDIFRTFTNKPNITEFSLEIYNRWDKKYLPSQTSPTAGTDVGKG